MLHLLKRRTGADQPARHWRVEALGFLADAAQHFTPAMRHRIDLSRLYAGARQQAETAAPESSLPAICPWTLDALLAETPDLDRLLAAL